MSAKRRTTDGDDAPLTTAAVDAVARQGAERVLRGLLRGVSYPSSRPGVGLRRLPEHVVGPIVAVLVPVLVAARTSPGEYDRLARVLDAEDGPR